MNKFMVVDSINDGRWDKFVERHPFGWICHLSGWKQSLEENFPHMKGHCLAISDGPDMDIKAGLILFEVRSWLTGNRMVSIPFASLSDPLIRNGNDFERLFEAALDLSDKMGINSFEIKTLHSAPFIQQSHMTGSYFYKHHYLTLDKKPEDLREAFHHTIRQKIECAIENKLKVREDKDGLGLQNFYRLYLMTRKRLGLPPMPFQFIKSIYETFLPSKRIALVLAEHEGKTVGGLMLFKFRGRVSAEFIVHDDAFRTKGPIHFLFWESIKSAYYEGYRVFDFGRTSPDDRTIMDFKKRWGTEEVHLPSLYYPEQKGERERGQESSQGYKLMKALCNIAPGFTFRQIGQFCYRHLG